MVRRASGIKTPFQRELPAPILLKSLPQETEFAPCVDHGIMLWQSGWATQQLNTQSSMPLLLSSLYWQRKKGSASFNTCVVVILYPSTSPSPQHPGTEEPIQLVSHIKQITMRGTSWNYCSHNVLQSYCFEGSTNSLYSIIDRYLLNLFLKTSSNRDFTKHLGKKSQQVPNRTTSEPFCHPTTSPSKPRQCLFTPFMMTMKKADRLGGKL